MAIDPNLLLAILSMDSYNRSYDEGIEGLGGAGLNVGAAELLNVPLPTGSQAIGFHAAAYDTPYGLVISYRGTDGDMITDITHSWPIALGYTVDNQASLALDFYNAVEGHAGAILTGHSLGGGLAGYLLR